MMKLSVRNQIKGKVTAVVKGQTTGQVTSVNVVEIAVWIEVARDQAATVAIWGGTASISGGVIPARFGPDSDVMRCGTVGSDFVMA